MRSEGTGALGTVCTVLASSTVLGVDPTEYLAKAVKYDPVRGFLFTGYFLHYFPFFLTSRQLFLHHYLPALYFGILLTCAVFDFCDVGVEAQDPTPNHGHTHDRSDMELFQL